MWPCFSSNSGLDGVERGDQLSRRPRESAAFEEWSGLSVGARQRADLARLLAAWESASSVSATPRSSTPKAGTGDAPPAGGEIRPAA
jgi:hypothetical protein